MISLTHVAINGRKITRADYNGQAHSITGTTGEQIGFDNDGTAIGFGPLAHPDLHGAVADGVTDCAAALQRALNTGKWVFLAPGKTYAFGSRLIVPDGGGFIGGGKLLMLTGAGKFDAADYAQSYDRTVGIYAEGMTNIRIEAQISMQANASIRTCSPVWVRNCVNPRVDVEVSGFKEMRFGAVEWNSNVGGSAKVNGHDIYSNSTTLGSMQLTVVSVDNNRYNPGSGPINSTSGDFDVRAKDIYMGAAALTQYGYQTDGISLMGSGWTGHTVKVRAENVHEPVDCWSDGNKFDITATNYLFVKFLYGASHNTFSINGDLFFNSGVYFGGGGATQSTSYNVGTITCRRGGQIGTFANVAAVTMDGGNATNKTSYNEVTVKALGNGADLDFAARLVDCSNNVVRIDGTGFVTAATDLGTNNIVKRSRPTLVRANLSANQTYADLATIICDTETIDRHGEYDPTTGIFTAKCPGTYRVKFKASFSVSAGQKFGSYIRKNSTTDISRKGETNVGAGGGTFGHEHSALVQCVAGDTIAIRNDGVATTTTFSGSDTTYIEIEEV